MLQAGSLMNVIYSSSLVGLSTFPELGSQITSAHTGVFVSSVPTGVNTHICCTKNKGEGLGRGTGGRGFGNVN